MSTYPDSGTPRRSFVRRNPLLLLVAAVLVLAAAGVAGYFAWKRTKLPLPGTPRYEEYVEAFNIGVAALDVGVGDEAEKNLNRAIELVPQEPAAWANRGLFYLRSRQFPKAASDLAEAERLAPDDPAIQSFMAMLDEQEGRLAQASARFRKVVEKDPRDVESLYHLAVLISKEDPLNSDKEYQELMERIVAVRPNNIYVLIVRLRVALRRDDRAAVQDTMTRFEKLAPNWNEKTQAQFALAKKAKDGDTTSVQTFGNVLMAEPGYPRGAGEVNPQDFEMGHPLRTFLKLVPMRNSPSPPDTDLAFTTEAIADAPAGRWDVLVPVWLNAKDPPAIFAANAKEVRRLGTALSLPSFPLAPDGLVALDWNNDFRTDLLLFGPSGLRFYQQGADGNFIDVTAKTGLPADVLNGEYVTALVADIDLDGDLDIVLARRTGPPLMLRNNLDGTFTPKPIFAGVEGARAFAWVDLDNDGAPDAAVLDSKGKLHVFANDRSGQLLPWPTAVPAGEYLALAVADANDDGALDLVALRVDGAIIRISDRDKRSSWDVAELVRWTMSGEGATPGSVRLIVTDLDNNGVPDLLASRSGESAAWLGFGGGKFERLAGVVPPHVVAAEDLGGNGRLEMLALDAEGRPIRARGAGKKDYHWQTIRFLAQPQENLLGDNRINSFGIGGEIEVRTGTSFVKRPLAAPAVHIGLGERTRADVVRILWPNGTVQIEFRPDIDQTFSPQQRLKGSCPFLFTWNGEQFVFVTDILWSSPLGLYINAQNRGGVAQTTEWVKVRGDQLVPRDGHYEVRAQANLWETHFFDHLALQVVDHPADTELFVDERFALEPSKPTSVLTGPTRPVAKATDHLGGDATEVVRTVDGVYLDRCGRGKYQGITGEHWVEVDLGDDAPKDGPVWLIAHSWIHPTDSSINFAIEQGQHVRPHGLILEVPDGQGGWKVVRDEIGFPAGKNKTVLLRLDGLDGPGVSRRFRIRTNREIFWDALHYGSGRDDAEVRRNTLLPVVADLRFRGILEMTQANASSPELPHYDRVVARGQVWRDLIGFHTRFGDVKELLEKTDDRYAILNAGDEIALKFAVPPGPPPGWKRDFIWVSDGWEKDGDFNTRFGKTVLPLPYHEMPSYDVPPGRLEDDPVFRRFPKDWDAYHTRYVTPFGFERGLRPR